MTVADPTRIDRTIEIDAPPDRVWRALTDAGELSAWFQVRIEGELTPGSDIWMTSTHAGHAGQRFHVRIVAMERPHRLVWQWHPGAVDPAVDYSKEPFTTVTFTVEPAGRGTRVSVAETGFDRISLARRARVYEDNVQGWSEVLVWLQRHAQDAR
jgi:uncharacterized protein YndB with AHSA1/START domain